MAVYGRGSITVHRGLGYTRCIALRAGFVGVKGSRFRVGSVESGAESKSPLLSQKKSGIIAGGACDLKSQLSRLQGYHVRPPTDSVKSAKKGWSWPWSLAIMQMQTPKLLWSHVRFEYSRCCSRCEDDVVGSWPITSAAEPCPPSASR